MKNTNGLLIGILTAFFLSACGQSTPSADVNVPMTSVLSTMVASYFGTLTAIAPPLTSTPVLTQVYIPFLTNTPFYIISPPASSTFVYYTATLGSLTPRSPTPTGTLTTPTINPGALALGCNNLYFIRDVNIPTGTVLGKNQDFTKTWKVQNNGTCDWLFHFVLVPISGETFGGGSTKIKKVVKVNDWSELSVELTSPNKPGTYTSYWRLSNGQGMFGATLAVSIIVSAPPASTPIPTITNTPSPQPTNTFTLVPTETSTSTPTPTSTP